MEHLIWSMGLTPLAHPLSFQILETNNKSGNMGQTLILLNLQKAPYFPPQIFYILCIDVSDDISLGMFLGLLC